MINGIVKHDPRHDFSFFYPKYWPLLTSWANYLNASLPFPANQLCTDDFTGSSVSDYCNLTCIIGRLANNTNLAAKG